MDFASTLRVLAKHKILVAVLLLLTLGGTAYALTSSAETKEAAGASLILAAPQPQPIQTATGPVTPVVNNKYNSYELPTVVDILVRKMRTQQIAAELKDEGLVGTYGVAGNLDFVRGPLFEMNVTSPTPEDALAGYSLLDAKLTQTLRQLQVDAGADQDYLISVQQVSEPVVSTPGLVGRVRTGIALLAVGVVFTVGLTLVVESLSQRRRQKPSRRQRRRDRRSAPDASTEEGAPQTVVSNTGHDSGRPDERRETEVAHEPLVDTAGTSSASMDSSSFAAPSTMRAAKVELPIDPTRG